MISVIKWAWQAKPDTPAEKLVLVSLANSTFQTPREDIAVVGVRALRGTACDMTPAELDAILDRLEKQGFITPLAADSEPVKWHIARWSVNVARKVLGRHGVSTPRRRKRRR